MDATRSRQQFGADFSLFHPLTGDISLCMHLKIIFIVVLSEPVFFVSKIWHEITDRFICFSVQIFVGVMMPFHVGLVDVR